LPITARDTDDTIYPYRDIRPIPTAP